MEFNELKGILYESGVVGAGGAGFPAAFKLASSIDTIIINCAECEPLYKVDRQLLARYTREILSALSMIVKIVGANKGIAAVKSSYTEAIDAVEDLLPTYDNIELKPLPNIYPAGDEIVLIYEATGRIVPQGKLPVSCGVMVYNAETLLNIYYAVNKGKVVTHKYLTVTGAVNNPVTLRIPIGTPVYDVIKQAGGTSIENYSVLMGGVMTGRLIGENESVTKTTKCIVVLPSDHPAVIRRKTKNSINIKRVMAACSQCRFCTDLCPRALLGYNINPHKIMNAVASCSVSDEDIFLSAFLCSECGLCEMYSCHQGLSPRMVMSELKTKLRQKGITDISKISQKELDSEREGRRIPSKRLISRINIDEYDVKAPLFEINFKPEIVRVSLKQHVGVPGIPVVAEGDRVEMGQMIARIENGKLGAPIHASIDGTIENIDSSMITIKAGGGRNE